MRRIQVQRQPVSRKTARHLKAPTGEDMIVIMPNCRRHSNLVLPDSLE